MRLSEETKIKRARQKFLKSTMDKDRPLMYGQHIKDDKYYLMNLYSLILSDEPMEDIEFGSEDFSFNIGQIIPKDYNVDELGFVDLKELEENIKECRKEEREAKRKKESKLLKIKDGYVNAEMFLDVAKCVDVEEVCVYREPKNTAMHLIEGRFGKAILCPINMNGKNEGEIPNLVMEV